MSLSNGETEVGKESVGTRAPGGREQGMVTGLLVGEPVGRGGGEGGGAFQGTVGAIPVNLPKKGPPGLLISGNVCLQGCLDL